MSNLAEIIDVPEAEGPGSTAVATRSETSVSAPANATANVLSMIERIMTDPNASVERANQAFDFFQKVQAEQARRAFIEAKAAFKATAPTIIKDMENKQYKSRYSSIGNVVNTLTEALSKHGFDANWEFDQGNASISVTCVLTHREGHSERVTLAGPPDTSGQKNPIQQIKSTTTYLKLATFEAVTGIASKDGNADDDGNGADPSRTLLPAHVDTLFGLIAETNSNIDQFLAVAKVAPLGDRDVDSIKMRLADIRASEYPRLVGLLEAKKRKAARS
jgi:hypothetical protein